MTLMSSVISFLAEAMGNGQEISETRATGFPTQSVSDSQSVAESDLHTQYLIQFQYSPQ